MRRLILIILFTIPFFSGSVFAQENCTNFSIGKFRPKFGPSMNNYEIIRTDSTQTDFDKIYQSKTEYQIIWLDECHYKLKKISGKINEGFQGFDLAVLTFTIDHKDSLGFGYLITIDGTKTLLDTTRLVRVD